MTCPPTGIPWIIYTQPHSCSRRAYEYSTLCHIIIGRIHYKSCSNTEQHTQSWRRKMEGPKPNSAYQGHRGACDQCSQRKVRCTPANGACQNCVAWGKTCTYSPKIPAGRPRKKQTTSQKDNAYEATEQNQASARRPAMQPHINRHQSSHELPTLTRSSVSLNSIESQVTTPPNER